MPGDQLSESYSAVHGDSRPSPALPQLPGELICVEIVAPRVDFLVSDFEGTHDRQFERLVGELEDVDPLGHHDWTIRGDVDDAELDAFYAWRTWTNERGDRVGDLRLALDGLQRDVVVDGILGEERLQLGDVLVVGPRCAE